MKSRANNFDAVARSYDLLARLVFGNSIRKAQRKLLPLLASKRSVLIIGGGTGWILEDMLRINAGLRIVYLDASSNMIDMAKKRMLKYPSAKVEFRHGTDQDLTAGETYDVVVANFFFDMFVPITLTEVIGRISTVVRSRGDMIVTDFTAPRAAWQSFLMKAMYSFFRYASKLEATKLPPWDQQIVDGGFREESSSIFYNGFIVSRHYRKTQ